MRCVSLLCKVERTATISGKASRRFSVPKNLNNKDKSTQLDSDATVSKALPAENFELMETISIIHELSRTRRGSPPPPGITRCNIE